MLPVSLPELTTAVHRLSTLIGYCELTVAGRGVQLPYSCAEILQEQESGADPTASWRELVNGEQARFYHCAPRPQVGAAFVHGWYASIVAIPSAWLAVHTPFLVSCDPAALRFDLMEPSRFPCAVSIDPGAVSAVANAAVRRRRAEENYVAHVSRFTRSYRPGIKMSSKQRDGMVRDHWQMALSAATEHTSTPVPARLRESCCFIVALPGAQACAACPQRANEWTPPAP